MPFTRVIKTTNLFHFLLSVSETLGTGHNLWLGEDGVEFFFFFWGLESGSWKKNWEAQSGHRKKLFSLLTQYFYISRVGVEKLSRPVEWAVKFFTFRMKPIFYRRTSKKPTCFCSFSPPRQHWINLEMWIWAPPRRGRRAGPQCRCTGVFAPELHPLPKCRRLR